MKAFSIAVLILGLSLAGCKKSTGFKVEHYTDASIQDLPLDQKIPVQAWDLLEGKEHSNDGHGDEEKHEAAEAHGAKPPTSNLKNTVLGEIKVFLVEKNPGVLNHPAIQILLPRGGGRIDLAAFTTRQRGTFFVGFEFPSLATATRKKVLFFSQARKRKLDGQIFGAGCNQFFDITDGFLTAMDQEGFKVNTTQDRHLSFLGGSFYFAAETAGEMSVAQVRFFDSTKNQLFCQEN